jgi:putative heme iron utilization protein
MSQKSYHIHQAALLMRTQHTGVLSTHSLSMQGYPFGSVMPFLMTQSGDLIVYASDIAQHSRNMKQHNKVSLCVYDNQQSDSQASARITILGTSKVDAVNAELQAQYMAVFPQAKAYVEAHDFRFYIISTQRVRYIGGFGEIYWFSQDEWQSHMFDLASSAPGAIEHMHEDHGDALALIVAKQLKRPISKDSVTMLTCFSHGFHYACPAQETNADKSVHVGFIPFSQPISKDHGLRHAMVILTKHARTDSTPEIQSDDSARDKAQNIQQLTPNTKVV